MSTTPWIFFYCLYCWLQTCINSERWHSSGYLGWITWHGFPVLLKTCQWQTDCYLVTLTIYLFLTCYKIRSFKTELTNMAIFYLFKLSLPFIHRLSFICLCIFLCLTHFKSILHFHTCWKHHTTWRFLMLSGTIDMKHWREMGYKRIGKTKDIVAKWLNP